MWDLWVIWALLLCCFVTTYFRCQLEREDSRVEWNTVARSGSYGPGSTSHGPDMKRTKIQAHSPHGIIQFANASIGPVDMEEPLLKEINLSLFRGAVSGVLGPTGSGKSTFLKSIQGNLPTLYADLRVTLRPLSETSRLLSKLETKLVLLAVPEVEKAPCYLPCLGFSITRVKSRLTVLTLGILIPISCGLASFPSHRTRCNSTRLCARICCHLPSMTMTTAGWRRRRAKSKPQMLRLSRYLKVLPCGRR